MKLLNLIVFFAFVTNALGKIGENSAECSARYGQPVRVTADRTFYEKNGIRVTVAFADDKRCAMILYSPISNDGKPFTKSQRTALLKMNKGRKDWPDPAVGTLVMPDRIAVTGDSTVMVRLKSFKP